MRLWNIIIGKGERVQYQNTLELQAQIHEMSYAIAKLRKEKERVQAQIHEMSYAIAKLRKEKERVHMIIDAMEHHLK